MRLNVWGRGNLFNMKKNIWWWKLKRFSRNLLKVGFWSILIFRLCTIPIIVSTASILTCCKWENVSSLPGQWFTICLWLVLFIDTQKFFETCYSSFLFQSHLTQPITYLHFYATSCFTWYISSFFGGEDAVWLMTYLEEEEEPA